MRKVRYSQWINKEDDYKMEDAIGTFHSWGTAAYQETQGTVDGTGCIAVWIQQTMALVETEEGRVLLIHPDNIQFLDKED